MATAPAAKNTQEPAGRAAVPLLRRLEGLSQALLSAGGGFAGKEPGAR